MLYFFYCTRNILGPVMVISPLVGFLYIDFNFDLFVVFLLSAMLGLPFGLHLYKPGLFKAWTMICSVTCCIASGVHIITGSSASLYCTAFVLGLLMSTIAVIFPADMAAGWFRSSKTQVLGLIWTLSIMLGVSLGILTKRFTYLFWILSCLMIAAGIVFSEEPPHQVLHRFSSVPRNFAAGNRHSATFKICSFAACIAFSAGLGPAGSLASVVLDSLQSAGLFLIAGLCTGPAVSALMIHRRGVYSGSVLLLFMAQISAACTVQFPSMILPSYMAYLASGLCFGSIPVIFPVLAYYICGPDGFNLSLCRIAASFLAGFIASISIVVVGIPMAFYVLLPAIAMLLLVFAFFTIFSAWKGRIFLLKNSGM